MLLEIDNDIALKFENGNGFETGILIGARRDDRIIVLESIITPIDDETSIKDKKSKLDALWIANHCENITKMLPSGLEIVGVISTLDHNKKLDDVIWECFGEDETNEKDYRVLISISQNNSLQCLLYDMKNWGSSVQSRQDFKPNLTDKFLKISTKLPLYINSIFDTKLSLGKNLRDIFLHWEKEVSKLFPVFDEKVLNNDKYVQSRIDSIFNKNSHISFYGENLFFVLMNGNTSSSESLFIEGHVCGVSYVLKSDLVGSSVELLKKDLYNNLKYKLAEIENEMSGNEEDDEEENNPFEDPTFWKQKVLSKIILPPRYSLLSGEKSKIEYLGCSNEGKELRINNWKFLLGESAKESSILEENEIVVEKVSLKNNNDVKDVKKNEKMADNMNVFPSTNEGTKKNSSKSNLFFYILTAFVVCLFITILNKKLK
eukprot:TRINITY_DN6521_c0_g1_i1.p1 TRINITY_DN6521_c0_g1~~TRINITY_DN6521_c0_g1_i1.p1  ORF type:complete len:431 (-),score=117.07 TRINITY_DN6521_c0_g1_i1:2-1294(-)